VTDAELDIRRRGLLASLAGRLQAASHDELRVLDRVLTRLEQQRFTWRRRIATTARDADTRWHLASIECGCSFVTRCHGRWSKADGDERSPSPPVAERCLACQRAGWEGVELDQLIGAVLELLAAEDRERADLRESARAEMIGDPIEQPEAYDLGHVELGGEGG
jgi:hypothetical protein